MRVPKPIATVGAWAHGKLEPARIAAEQATLPNARLRAKIDQETWTKFADRLEWLEKRQREKREKSANSTLTEPADEPERA